VKDPQYFSKSVFGLINTAFEVEEEIEEIEVTDEDLEALDPPAEESNVKTEVNETPEGIQAENIINLDDSNVKIVGGKDEEPTGTEESLEL
jgi:hypothetical protein